MVATITVAEILEIARSAGFDLRLANDGSAPLYLWATPDDDVVYVGKTEADGRLRFEDGEVAAVRADPHMFRYGFQNLVIRNDATSRPIFYQGFDPQVALEHLEHERWYGRRADLLKDRLMAPDPVWSVPDVEAILIRIAIHRGVPIGNAASASQWEGWLDNPRDLVAVVGVDRYEAALEMNSDVDEPVRPRERAAGEDRTSECDEHADLGA